jgi:hypothetical protein
LTVLTPPWPEIYERIRSGVTAWTWHWPISRTCFKLTRHAATKSRFCRRSGSTISFCLRLRRDPFYDRE